MLSAHPIMQRGQEFVCPRCGRNTFRSARGLAQHIARNRHCNEAAQHNLNELAHEREQHDNQNPGDVAEHVNPDDNVVMQAEDSSAASAAELNMQQEDGFGGFEPNVGGKDEI